MVFLGIAGGTNCNSPYGMALASPQLQAITKVFSDANRGLFWDLCEGDIPGALDQAVTILDTGCAEAGG